MMKRRNRISGQFAVRTIEMLESPAYRALSVSAHKVIARVEIELAHHGGNDNGKLPVTYQNFIDYGLPRKCIPPALREACALGFVEITKHGRGGNAEFREPNWYRLTFAFPRGGRSKPPTDEWKKIETMEQAREVAKAARSDKSQAAVAMGKRGHQRRLSKTTTKIDYVQPAPLPRL